MIAEHIKSLAGCFGVQPWGVEARDDWLNFSCPYAPWTHHNGTDANPSFGIRVNKTGESVFKCWACGKTGLVADLVGELLYHQRKQPGLTSYNIKYALEILTFEVDDETVYPYEPVDFEAPIHTEEVIYPKDWLATFYKKYTHPYLTKRGIPEPVAKSFDVRIDISDKRVCTPLRSFTGALLGLQGRSFDNSELRYKMYDYKGRYNPYIWGNEINCNLDDTIVLTEGSFDAMKIAIVYPNVLFSLTSSLSVRKLKRIRDADKIITFYDYGTGGDTARTKISNFFKNTDSVVFDIIPDNEWSDAGAMPPQEIMKQLKKYIIC